MMNFEDDKLKRQFEADYQNSKKTNISYKQIMRELAFEVEDIFQPLLESCYLTIPF